MKHIIKLLTLLATLLPALGMAQTFTISGTITDRSSGETLIGATVLDTRSGKGTVTNVNGRYSLTLKADSVNLRITYIGYEVALNNLKLDRNTTLNFDLKPSVQLDEVVITAEKPGDTRSSQMSAMQVTVEQIKAVPVLFGEADLIKALQLMPGVQSGSEGNSGMYVRGGGPDENLFLLDGIPLYNVNHLGGFFSAFNTDAVKNVTLYKGSFPARFGGRLSSVLDVTTNNGNDKELHGNASIGLISAKINLEGPIIKERTTFNVSARRTYADLILIPIFTKMIPSMSNGLSTSLTNDGDLGAGYYFYDLNAKVTHKFNDRNRLYATFYTGLDDAYGTVQMVSSLMEDQNLGFHNQWGNLVGALRWNYVITPKLFFDLTAAYTQYNNVITGNIKKVAQIDGDEDISTMKGDYNSGIKDITLRADFNYNPQPEHDVRFGTYLTRHFFTPEVMSATVDYIDQVQMGSKFKMDTTINSSLVPATEMVAYAEDDWELGERVKLNFGLHASGFYVDDTLYPSLQPRVSGRVMLTDDISVKAGYAYMKQYMHLLSTTSISMPTDLWVPVTRNIKPMESHQIAAGISYSRSGIADFSIEGYYKRMSNLIEYKDGASFFGTSDGWENLVVTGDGWAYGIEFLAQRNIGNLTGWIGYTYSRTTHLFDRPGQELNEGRPFPAKYDRHHDISIVLSYKITSNIDVSATWVYSSGNAATLALQKYPVAFDDPEYYNNPDLAGRHGSLSYISSRNNFRMPDYHRLDIGANFHRQFKRKNMHRTINVSIYNVYNRQNPYMIYPSRRYQYRDYNTALVKLSLFPILPSAAYTLYF
ncbi:MAG: carboxypeptidase-like regulatory domain-containing protein [Bacteroidales bacterium]|nr:carboxypeptidase-like regulatory domain-containing protein [Bacteroidales bacterium]